MNPTTCVICLEKLNNPYRTECNHTFCKDCITKWANVKTNCPCCRRDLTNNENLIILDRRIYMGDDLREMGDDLRVSGVESAINLDIILEGIERRLERDRELDIISERRIEERRREQNENRLLQFLRNHDCIFLTQLVETYLDDGLINVLICFIISSLFIIPLVLFITELLLCLIFGIFEVIDKIIEFSNNCIRKVERQVKSGFRKIKNFFRRT